MKKISTLLLLFVGLCAYGQLDTIDLSITDFGLPSRPGEADFMRNEAYKMNQGLREIDSLQTSSLVHAFVYFGDSTISKSYTTSWAQLTNASDSIFIHSELEGFTMKDDSITFTYGGDYNFTANFSHDGDNGETVSIRFYNTTTPAGVAVAGSQKGGGSGDIGSTPIIAYGEVSAGDVIVIQYKGDNNGTAVFKNGVVRIDRAHE
jgi:hypothetical protein